MATDKSRVQLDLEMACDEIMRAREALIQRCGGSILGMNLSGDEAAALEALKRELGIIDKMLGSHPKCEHPPDGKTSCDCNGPDYLAAFQRLLKQHGYRAMERPAPFDISLLTVRVLGEDGGDDFTFLGGPDRVAALARCLKKVPGAKEELRAFLDSLEQ